MTDTNDDDNPLANMMRGDTTQPSNRPDPALDRQAYEEWYYRLTPEQQHAEWQRYYQQSHAAQRGAHRTGFGTYAMPGAADSGEHELPSGLEDHEPRTIAKSVEDGAPSVARLKDRLRTTVKTRAAKTKQSAHFKPVVSAVFAGSIFLFANYNNLLTGQIKQYLSPGSAVNTPVIIDAGTSVAVGPEPKVIIPKINVEAPVVYDEKSYDDKLIQKALERGVVHYGETALPGQNGNNVIVGHSSSNFFNAGKYKFAFLMLGRLEVGDTFILHYNGTRYIYKVYNKAVIDPTDFSLIQPTGEPIATLITCDPPGTNWKRMVIQGKQISPDPAQAVAVTPSLPGNPAGALPSNSPSLFQRIRSIFSGD